MNPPKNIYRILIFAFFLETLCVTYGLYIPSLIGVLSVLYTFSGLTVAFALLWMRPDAAHITLHTFSFKPLFNRYRWAMMGMALMMTTRFFRAWKADIPLDYHDADMLPIIKIMCERFLSGQWSHVYDPIPEIWGGIQPIYLPGMWLPFALPLWLHIDIRWVTVLLFFLVFCIFVWKINPYRKHALPVIAGAFLLFWWLFADDRAGLVPYTEEGVVIFFYVFLVLALHRQNAWLIGLAISLCVLSRYALIGWLPAYLLYLISRKEWKTLLRIILMGLICFLLLVLLPFGFNMIKSLIALPGAYIDFARRIWHDSPHVFQINLGWAKFFGAHRIETQHYLLIYLSFGLPLLLMILGIELHKRLHIPEENLPLVILKVAMVIFYTFIDVPYLYLYYTSSFVSLIAVTYFVVQEKTKSVRRRH